MTEKSSLKLLQCTVPVRIGPRVLLIYRLRWRITWVGSFAGSLAFYPSAYCGLKKFNGLVLRQEQSTSRERKYVQVVRVSLRSLSTKGRIYVRPCTYTSYFGSDDSVI